MDEDQKEEEELPLDWAELILDEEATDEECDDEWTQIFWE